MRNLALLRIVLAAIAVIVLPGCSAERKPAALLDRANDHYNAGEMEKARIEYLNVLQQEPENVRAIERVGLIWLERGAPMRALPFLLQAKRAAPDNLELRLKLAQLILTLGKAAEARKEALAIIERSSSAPDALVLLTEAVRSQEDHQQAEQALQKHGDRNSASYHIAAANLLLLRGNARAAHSALQRGISADPKSPETHLAMASFHAAQGNTAQAAEEFKTAADLSPIRSVARVKYAGYLAQTGSVTEAIAHLKKITQEAPEYLPARRGLAQIALLEKKYDESLELLQNLLGRDPSNYEGLLLRAQVWLARGDVKQAIEGLERLSKDHPDLGVVKHQLALAYLQGNDQPKAIGALHEAISQNPDDVEAILTLALLNLRAGEFELVANAMAELVTHRPNVVQAYMLLMEALRSQGRLEKAAQLIAENLRIAPHHAQLHYLLGLIYSQQQKPAEARQSFASALNEAPEHLPAMTELINLDLKEGKHTDAVARAQALIVRFPAAAAPRFLEAKGHAGQGHWDEAEASLLKTLELDGQYPGAHGLLAESFAARKHQPGISEQLESFLTKRPNDELAVVVVAQTYARLNRFTNARDTYEKLLLARPDSLLVLNNLANLYDDKLAEPERALELARKARSLQPRAAEIADTLGWILYRRQNYQEAWTLLQESAGKLPQNPEVQFHLGMASLKLGKNDEALAAFRLAANASASFSGKDEAKRQLALLEQRLAPASASGGDKAKQK